MIIVFVWNSVTAGSVGTAYFLLLIPFLAYESLYALEIQTLLS